LHWTIFWSLVVSKVIDYFDSDISKRKHWLISGKMK